MIHDVDESLRALLSRDLFQGATDVDVSFEAPTTDWAARRNTPTIDVYLYDIRENLGRREVMYEDVRDDTGRVTNRRPPPRRFDLAYLVTAWTQRAEDEHRLLAACLGCFLRYEALPAEVLAGVLADQDNPAYVKIALPPSADRNISDVWSALGGELKPSLDLVVTAPFVLEGPLLRLRAGDADDVAVERARRRSESQGVRRPAHERGVLASEEVDGAAGDEQRGRRYMLHELES